MGWKCSPQVIGLVRGEPKKGQKHRANVKAIVLEVGKERVSKTENVDRDRTHLNQYVGFDSGYDCSDYLINKANNYRQEVIGKGGTKHERKLREDAVIAFSIIYNPPEEVCRGWDDATYQKFYEDSRAVMEQIQPDIFRKDNVVMTAEHYDEGTILDHTKISRHIHDVGIPMDKNGHYCGTKIDAKLCVDISKNYPKLMRERGWDIDDLDCTDWERYKNDKAYREERKAKQQSGKDVNNYIAAKMRKQVKENEAVAEELQTLLQDVLAKEAEFSTLAQEKAILEAEKERMQLEREEIHKQRGDLFRAKITQEKKEKEFQHKEDMLDAQKKALEQDRKNLEIEKVRYKLELKSKFDEKYRKYKFDCDEKVRIALEKVNKLPKMSEVVERVLDSAYVRMRMGEDMPARKMIEKQQQWNKSRADDIEDIVSKKESTGFDFDF